jgi:hypothetical protein
MKITMIHALQSSIAPAEEAFARILPAAKPRSILDEGLSFELARSGALDARMTTRFLALGRYAAFDNPDAILFTCSAFGPCVERVRTDIAPIPVRKPTDGMIAIIRGLGQRIALIAWFAPTLKSLPFDFPLDVEIVPVFVAGAQAAHLAGDWKTHDRLVTEAALAVEADAYVLAQFSIARAADELRTRTATPVLTTLDSAMLDLRGALQTTQREPGVMFDER